MGLPDVSKQRLARSLKCVPTSGVLQWRDGLKLTPVEADQRCIDQFVHVHHLGQGIDIDTRPLPDFGTGCSRQDRLNINDLGG